MSPFEQLADTLRMPLVQGSQSGLRRAQISAIHSICSHFWSRQAPCLVVMPTGTGKTAVMTAATILLRARRVLVVAPSRLLRDQLATGFRTLKDLRSAGAIESEAAQPKVIEVRKQLTDKDRWEELRSYDAVIGTPSVLSPDIDAVSDPPPDLFDVILFDEAHHVPAPTFTAIAEAFPSARQVLFTATPFRRDEREIRADLAFIYHLADARREGLFGKLTFEAVTATGSDTDDEAIARAACARLATDRASGLDHRLFVRAASRPRAIELEKLYKGISSLQLPLIHSGHAASRIDGIIKKLRAGEVDGVIAVDMLGEGFDLPQLKVAALHAPHRSLAVTLQFIGRFARTSGDNLGPASFFAIAREVEGEAQRLFVPGSEWNEIVEDLSGKRIAHEKTTRETIGSFRPSGKLSPDQANAARDSALLWSMRPFLHAKVYHTPNNVDLGATLAVPDDMEPLLVQYSEAHHALFYAGRTVTPLRWCADETWRDVNHDMFMILHVPEKNLAFVFTSRRHNAVYDALIGSITSGAQRLAPDETGRVFNKLQRRELFSVGMRNRASIGAVSSESYRILTGRAAHKAIRAAETTLYEQGHAMCRGDDGNQAVTLGFSSGAKIWTNRWDQIPAALEWAREMAARIRDSTVKDPESLFDQLSKGRRVNALPAIPIAGDLPPQAYRRHSAVLTADGNSTPLTDFSITIESKTETSITFSLRNSSHELPFLCSFAPHLEVQPLDAAASEAKIVENAARSEDTLAAYLNEHPPMFLLANLAMVQGDILTDAPTVSNVAIASQIEEVDWPALGINPHIEKPSRSGGKSLFDYVEDRAKSDGAAVLFLDDSTNEIADYVAVRDGSGGVLVQLFHCKAAKGKRVPRDRVTDLYDVLGQAIKCRRWLDARALVTQIEHRESKTSSRFIVGNLARLKKLLADGSRVGFEVVIVQPGLSTQPKPVVVDLLLAADAYHRGANSHPLRFIGTKP
ncbi:MAG: DEAD/DEAH box helicase family protein [Polyangiaceae bacterium]|nr:DEAD/DEAH box helicase family protein [Polyangiaceae bacterium]